MDSCLFTGEPLTSKTKEELGVERVNPAEADIELVVVRESVRRDRPF
jgi:hypothetical protein